jgi:hypothetical protein
MTYSDASARTRVTTRFVACKGTAVRVSDRECIIARMPTSHITFTSPDLAATLRAQPAVLHALVNDLPPAERRIIHQLFGFEPIASEDVAALRASAAGQLLEEQALERLRRRIGVRAPSLPEPTPPLAAGRADAICHAA